MNEETRSSPSRGVLARGGSLACAALVVMLSVLLASPGGSQAATSRKGTQIVPGYEYKIAFSGQGYLSSSDSDEGYDNTQAANWSVVPSKPVEMWVAKFNSPAGASYKTTASSPDVDPKAGTMIENGHWLNGNGTQQWEEAYSCQGGVGVGVVAEFAVSLGSAPKIRTDFAGSGMGAGHFNVVGADPGSCTNTPPVSGIEGMTGFEVFWLPQDFTAPGTEASGQMLAVGAPIPQQDIGRYSFGLLAEDYSQVTDPVEANVCPYSLAAPPCTLKFQLKGDYKFTEVCPGKVAVSPGGTPAGTCYSDKRLEDAANAARRYAKEAKTYRFAYVVSCAGTNEWQHISLSVFNALGGKGDKIMCNRFRAQWHEAERLAAHFREIAHDPPDARFTSVAHPRSPRVKGLASLRRFLPANYRLLRRDSQVAGLVGAVATSLNRVGGALLAVSQGDQAAAADLAKQQQAAHSYGRRAARLLRSRHRLALKAAAELRRLASGVHGPAAGRLRSQIRRFASSLASGGAAHADRLAAAALNAIGK